MSNLRPPVIGRKIHEHEGCVSPGETREICKASELGHGKWKTSILLILYSALLIEFQIIFSDGV